MGSRFWVLTAAAALLLAPSGCDGSAEPNDQPTLSGPGDAAALVGAPDVGTCWAMTPESAVDPDYWFDDSPDVSCTEPHTTETAKVLRLTRPTVAEAKQAANACWDEVRVYLGVNLDQWIHWGFAVVLPSREQIADGASWLRCEATFPTWDFSSVRTTTGSAAGVAIDPPAYLWACLNEHPKKPKQPFVPCDQPHRYEQTGTLAYVDHLVDYPPPAELAATAQRQCSYALPDEQRDVGLTARWDPRSVFRESSSIAGACFMYDKTGQLLAPRD